MASPGAYGSCSSILAISVFFNVQIHVWMYGTDLPEIYGSKSSKHYISLVKQCRSSHFNTLVCCDSSTHNFDARSRSKVVLDEADRRDREGMRARDMERAAEREDKKAREERDRAGAAQAEAKRNREAEQAEEAVKIQTAKVANEAKETKAPAAEHQPVDVDVYLVPDPVAALFGNPKIQPHVQPAALLPNSALVNDKAIHNDTRDFTRYHELSGKLLVWKSEFDVCAFSEKEGRGLINLVEIEKGNPIHRYGGDRVYCSIGHNEKSFLHKGSHNPPKPLNGNITYRPDQVRRLFEKYPTLDRTKNPGLKFQSTHAVMLGTNHPKKWKVTIYATAITIITNCQPFCILGLGRYRRISDV
jgi:hypothetical protein